MSITVKLAEEETIRTAIQNVRNDQSSTNWVLLGHTDGDPNVVSLQGQGENGLDGLKEYIKADQVQYALLRVTTKVDLSVTVKFVYIYNLGDELSFVKKGRFGVVKGDVTRHFQPYHVDLEITHPSELTQDVITKKVEDAAGNANHVRNAEFIQGKQERGYTPFMSTHTAGPQSTGSVHHAGSAASLTNIGGSKSSLGEGATSSATKSSYAPTKVSVGVVATQSQGLKFSDALVEAIRQVRNDKEPLDWVLGGYEEGDIKKPVGLVGKGSGGVADLKNHLKADNIAYGLVRVTDKIDGHPTIKFAFISWIGNQVPIMTKAKLSTHKGGVTEQFMPYHVDFTISELRDISQEIVQDKVASYSGSKSHVIGSR